jgi:hypothetical protein
MCALNSLPVITQAGDRGAGATLEKATGAAFSELERRVIREYLDKYGPGGAAEHEYGKTGKDKKARQGLPPGLARKKSLPPGLAGQLQKNGTLPPGLAKRDLPDDLRGRLPPAPEGYERSLLEDATVVLIEKATGRIADIISGTVRR